MKIKVYVFESVEDAVAFEHPEESRLKEVTAPDQEAVPITKETAKIFKGGPKLCGYCRSSDHRGKDCPKKPGAKRKIRTCSICGKPGHMAKTCPKSKPGADVAEKKSSMSDDEIREAVEDLQERGMNSLRVAQELKISLRKVNEFWKSPTPGDSEEEIT